MRHPTFLTAAVSALLVAMLASGCAVKEEKPVEQPPKVAGPEVKQPVQIIEKEPGDGKYYKDDGPPDFDEVDWRTVPDATPAFEAINAAYNRPYEVFGVRYLPFKGYMHYEKQGMASWYGRRYHGKKTSSGEIYDMYAMTAAHTILPIPSYARVTRVDDGRSIIVKVNDRGPFLNDRIIDLSYTAARKLGIVETGVGEVIVEALLPDDSLQVAKALVPQDKTKPQGKVSRASAKVDGDNYLQMGAFSSVENARNFSSSINLPEGMIVDDVSIKERDGLYRVLIGPYPSKFQAERDLDTLHVSGLEALLKIL